MQFGASICRTIDIVGCVTAGCVLVAAYGLGLRPLWGARDNQADIEYALISAQRAFRVAQEDVPRLQRENATADEQLAGVYRLSDHTQVNHTISLITELAFDEGLVVESGTAGEPVDSDPFAIVPIHIYGKGDFIATARFMRALNDKHPDIEVRWFTLDSKLNSSGSASGFSIKLAWYALSG